MHKSLPQYLEDRPQELVMHIKFRSPAPQFLIDNVVQLEDGTFTLPIDMKNSGHTVVSFGDENSYPSCQCMDWSSHRLPCMHFLAVFHHLGDLNTWDHLSPLYRSNPLFSVDQECITQQMTSKAATPNKVPRRAKADSSSYILQEITSAATTPKTAVEMPDGHASGSAKELEDLSNAALESIAYHFLANRSASPATSGEADKDAVEASPMDTSTSAASATETPAEPEKADGNTPSTEEETPASSTHNVSDAQITPESIVDMAETALLGTSEATTALKHLQVLRVLKHALGVQLKQLTEVIPSIMDSEVLERVVGHIEAALKEVPPSTGS